jgi:hypothetical protein
MSRLGIIAVLLFVAAPAYAQYTYDRPTECWNPGAGHFEQVRPGEYQNDLDYGRCRVINEYRGERPDTRAERYYNRNDGRFYYRADGNSECWNPGAGHFEQVRPGERQDDLDFSRCRPVSAQPSYGPQYYGQDGDRARECWNPRAGHYENVREGTFQADLDYSNCRWR